MKKKERTESLANSILNHVSTKEELELKTEQVLNKVGKLNYEKQKHNQVLHKIESDLHMQEQLLHALSLAKLLIDGQREQNEKENGGN